MKNKKSIPCGDWHLGWGYGGHDKIGKLSIELEPLTVTWRGSSQGRHGSKWNAGAFAKFEIVGDKLKLVEQKGSYPAHNEILQAANTLMRSNAIQQQVDGFL